MDTYILVNSLSTGPDQDRWTILRLRSNRVVARLEFVGTRDEAEARVDRLNAETLAAFNILRDLKD